ANSRVRSLRLVEKEKARNSAAEPAGARKAIGMAMGLYDPAFATLTGLYGRAARGPITGITLIAGFASTVGWPLSAFLDAQFGWREACFIWAALHIVIGLRPEPQRQLRQI